MGQPQIIEKLMTHLNLHQAPDEECHVLYLMAEIRKFLEQEKLNGRRDTHLILRFYGNWCMHHSIDLPSRFIAQITPDIINDARNCIAQNEPIAKGGFLASLLALEHLKQGLEDFFNEFHLPKGITVGANWEAFRSRFFNILSEQPFEEPDNCWFRIIYDRERTGDGTVEIKIKPNEPMVAIPFLQTEFA